MWAAQNKTLFTVIQEFVMKGLIKIYLRTLLRLLPLFLFLYLYPLTFCICHCQLYSTALVVLYCKLCEP